MSYGGVRCYTLDTQWILRGPHPLEKVAAVGPTLSGKENHA
ncbi:uncharacterized protein G2W53_044146 [Senna tora]|uniref:Uncharacterized protein n=1 Tax=Senna tora TaxID=362788 RepID=A0A834SMD5_9FABA|nr:uncharacterized protein G2W53_044146 [Senna tora]